MEIDFGRDWLSLQKRRWVICHHSASWGYGNHRGAAIFSDLHSLALLWLLNADIVAIEIIKVCFRESYWWNDWPVVLPQLECLYLVWFWNCITQFRLLD